MKPARTAIALTLVWALCLPALAAETLTYPDLVNRLTSLEHLAVLPVPGETCAQWSSWNRESQYDAESGKYIHWDANGDGKGFIREEDGNIVMAEMEGPGCIFRIWSARALEGHVKIYIDGAETPAVDLPFQNYFSGDTAPFAFPILSYDLANHGCRGQNLFIPIPYQKSCKVVAEPGWGAYYQFNYDTFPKGTRVPSFSKELVAENKAVLAETATFLNDHLGESPTPTKPGETTVSKTLSVPGEGSAVAAQLTGPRAITAIRAKTKFVNRADEMEALRALVLKITWDGTKAPAVLCPLGDFFGSAPGENLYRTLPTGMTQDGYYAYWYMPFAKSAKVELLNDGAYAREVELTIQHAPLGRDFEGLGHFHCKWHRDTEPLPEDRWPDWTMLETQGRGRFCGVMLHVWNPRGGWWGEGDEKFFVDGEKFPSTFGTGSEDYFGYAWCDPGLFQRPFHAQSMTQKNKGHQSVLRWQIADNIPFNKSFDGAIEKYWSNEEKGTLYACTPVWYLAPGGNDPYDIPPFAERHDYYVEPPLTAGGFKVLNKPAGEVTTQGTAKYETGKWEKDDQLWWRGAKPGDRLELEFEAQQRGRQPVAVYLTKARDYGIVQLYIDGKKAGDPIDLYDPEVRPSGKIALGTFPLPAGAHTLAVEILGANEKAEKGYMFGIDRIAIGK